MSEHSNTLTAALSLLYRYRKGIASGAGAMITWVVLVAVLLFYGVRDLTPVLSPHLVDAGMAPTTAALVAPVAIHVGFGTLLLAFFTYSVRTSFYNPSHDKGLHPFSLYLWAREFVEEQQLGGDGAEQWSETPPPWSKTAAAFGLGVVVLTVGLLFINVPVVGLALAIGAHGFARHRGLSPVRPLSWHFALTTLLVAVATAFLSALLHFDTAINWNLTIIDGLVGLISDLLVALPLYLGVSIVVLYLLLVFPAYIVVTYVGMYYLLVAYDGVRVRAGLVPTPRASSQPREETTAGTTARDSGTVDSSDSTVSRHPEPDEETDEPTPEMAFENEPASPAMLGTAAGFLLLLAGVLPLYDPVIGPVSAMFFSGLVFAMVAIFFGFPSGTLLDGIAGGAAVAAIGGIVVYAASLGGVVDGPALTALFWMAVTVGAGIGFLGRVATVADRSSSENSF